MNSIIWPAEGRFQWGGNNSDSRTASCYQPGLNISNYRFPQLECYTVSVKSA